MLYSDLTKKAIIIAYKAHDGQLDKGGYPYILHPIHLAEQMDTEEETIVAILHDTVEDTSVTFDYLKMEFSKDIIDALKLLTHNKDVDYEDYVEALSHNPIARKVKIADLKHNADISRVDNQSDIKKYEIYKKMIGKLDCR